MAFMQALLRDLGRQPWRTALTIAGIAIGIFALVVLGSLAEHFRAIVSDAKSYVRGTVRIVTKTNKNGENPGVTAEDVAAARAIPGVVAVVPTLTRLFDGYNLEEDPILFLAPKALVEGVPPELAARMRPGVRLVEGRWLQAGDLDAVMVVDWLARRRGYHVGGKVSVRHRTHTLVGIFAAPDVAVVPAGFVPFEGLKKSDQSPGVEQTRRFFAARRGSPGGAGDKPDPGSALALAQLEKLAEQLVAEQEERYYIHEVVPESDSLAATHAVAKELRRRLPHVAVIEPEALAEQMEKAVAIFLAITGVVSVISSLVGGLLIVNTMAMAVVERRREVSIKVAIGASTGQIAAEFVLEAALMGLAGALLGVGGGLAAIAILDPWIVAKVEIGASLFLVTPALVATSVSYGVGLGVVAGLVPAWRAARADPAPGLREL